MDADSVDLAQLARSLFDRAANFWWVGWGIELAAAAVGLVFGFWHHNDETMFVAAAVNALAFVGAYGLRLRADHVHDQAETIRRQSVYSDGLDWKIAGWQLGRWLERAGGTTRPHDPDYFATTAETGPRRIAEMTLESAFYSRLLFTNLSRVMCAVFALGALSLLALLWYASSRQVPTDTGLAIATAALATVPALASLDAFGRFIRLSSIANGLAEIERDLDEALIDPTDESVLRLVAEYNCLVIAGTPIPGFLFKMWHPRIARLWGQRVSSSLKGAR